jgi:anti-sigma B factor antagonist
MSNLTITKRQREGVVIVDLDGKIALGETNRQLHEAIRVLVQENKKNVVLNLAKVSGIDSSGLGELIAGYATLEKNDGTLKLVNLGPRVTELMTITKLLTVFDVFENETDAIASFETPEDKTTQPLDQSVPRSASGGSLL